MKILRFQACKRNKSEKIKYNRKVYPTLQDQSQLKPSKLDKAGMKS